MDDTDEARNIVHGMTAQVWKAKYQEVSKRGRRGLGIRNGAVRAVTNGGRYRDRTYGPYHVKVVLSR